MKPSPNSPGQPAPKSLYPDGGTKKSVAAVPEEEPSPAAINAQDLERELEWFCEILDARFQCYFDSGQLTEKFEISAPDPEKMDSNYGGFLRRHNCNFAERVAIVLALIPHIRPRLLDVFFTKNKTFDRRFTEFGGIHHRDTGDFLPTGETLAFLLGGTDLEIRFAVQELFDREHFFARQSILHLHSSERYQPLLKGTLGLTQEYLSLFTTGQVSRPQLSQNFPAQYIETKLVWDDLVLHPGTLRQIQEIETWIEHGDTLMNDWAMAAKLRPGFRALFYGPPGTGKTMTACLLGKATGHEVYKIDLSLVVSKYIGETEKNLSRIFDQAQQKNWILFFDEADALFGKRSETKSSHDRHANQEVSFLLQRIETFDGIAILASNLKENLDTAFARRFESMIYFPLPSPSERLKLWEQGFSPSTTLANDIDLTEIAERYELTGGAIINIIRYASLKTLASGGCTVSSDHLAQGIRRELTKEGWMK